MLVKFTLMERFQTQISVKIIQNRSFFDYSIQCLYFWLLQQWIVIFHPAYELGPKSTLTISTVSMNSHKSFLTLTLDVLKKVLMNSNKILSIRFPLFENQKRQTGRAPPNDSSNITNYTRDQICSPVRKQNSDRLSIIFLDQVILVLSVFYQEAANRVSGQVVLPIQLTLQWIHDKSIWRICCTSRLKSTWVNQNLINTCFWTYIIQDYLILKLL